MTCAFVQIKQINNNIYSSAFQPGLGACGASLSSPGRLVLSDLIGAGRRHQAKHVLHVQEEAVVNGLGLWGQAGVGGGAFGAAQVPYDEEAEEADYAAVVSKRKKGKKQPSKSADPEKKSVKAMLRALGVRAQKQTDADFTGHCPHCRGNGETRQNRPLQKRESSISLTCKRLTSIEVTVNEHEAMKACHVWDM